MLCLRLFTLIAKDARTGTHLGVGGEGDTSPALKKKSVFEKAF